MPAGAVTVSVLVTSTSTASASSLGRFALSYVRKSESPGSARVERLYTAECAIVSGATADTEIVRKVSVRSTIGGALGLAGSAGIGEVGEVGEVGAGDVGAEAEAGVRDWD